MEFEIIINLYLFREIQSNKIINYVMKSKKRYKIEDRILYINSDLMRELILNNKI